MSAQDPHEKWRTRSTAAAFRNAGEGLLYALRTQRHVPHYFVVIFLVLLSSAYLRLPPLEILFVLSAIMFVLVAEMLNTAIETIVNTLCPESHEGAKIAKDTACAAVSIACMYAACVLAIVYFNSSRLLEMATGSFADSPLPPIEIWVIGLLLVCLIVSMVKWRDGRGTLMRGGIVSGHASLSFYLATALVFVIQPVVWSLAGYLIAGMVAQSRVDGKIHSLAEVISGSVLGTVVALAAHYMGGIWF